MTANLRIAPYNIWDDLTLTNTEEAEAFPITNTQTIRRSKIFRSNEIDDEETVYILGTAPSVDESFINLRANCLFLFRHNLWGHEINVQLYDGTTIGAIGEESPTVLVYETTATTVAYSSPGTYDWGYPDTSDPLRLDPMRNSSPFVLWFPATYAFQQIAITITSAADDFTPEVGRFFLGNYHEVELNPDYGLLLGIETNGDAVRTRGGSLISSPGEHWKTLSAEFNRLSEAERALWLDIMRMNGTHRDFAMSVFPEDGTRLERDYTMNAKFTSLEAIGMEVSWRTKKLSAKEC